MINEQMLKDITVLYVEDDNAIQQNTIVTLELVNAKIIPAVDGMDGLEKFKANEEEIDIIVTDLSMPNMDGLEMIEEIKKINRDVPVLITTAHQDISYLKQAIELGVTSYIIKPIDIRNIIKSISKAIEPVNERKELLLKIKTLKEENESLKKQLEEKISR
ncbi:response regulator [Arcobacter roscoffensis]|uniref:Response regulator n=1 Tax=Arcobacter roscoffensis TaxID=2961520 RepID=A0ABY5E211_9BACT|nr:response regulator [Arcobacter roscoffensis]UTJ06229.1 response regulator [Arcobacter roscoffensis]